MRLTGPRGASLELSLLGYQFPELVTAPYDSNWLRVQLSVSGPLGTWTTIDPALLTYEVAGLATWLEDIADGRPLDPEWSALEPNLAFEWRPEESVAPLRARFAAEFRPPNTDREAALRDPCTLDLTVSRSDLWGAAKSLRQQLARFPQRTSE